MYISAKGDVTYYFDQHDFEHTKVVLDVTPFLGIDATGSGTFTAEVNIPKEPISYVIVGDDNFCPLLTLNLSFGFTFEATIEGTTHIELPIGRAEITCDFAGGGNPMKVDTPPTEPVATIKAKATYSFTGDLDLYLGLLDYSDKFDNESAKLARLGVLFTVTPEMQLLTEEDLTNNDVQHCCKPLECISGTFSVIFHGEIYFETDLLELIGDWLEKLPEDWAKYDTKQHKLYKNLFNDIEIVPEDKRTFYVRTNVNDVDAGIHWGTCPNMSYLTHIHVYGINPSTGEKEALEGAELTYHSPNVEDITKKTDGKGYVGIHCLKDHYASFTVKCVPYVQKEYTTKDKITKAGQYYDIDLTRKDTILDIKLYPEPDGVIELLKDENGDIEKFPFKKLFVYYAADIIADPSFYESNGELNSSINVNFNPEIIGQVQSATVTYTDPKYDQTSTTSFSLRIVTDSRVLDSIEVSKNPNETEYVVQNSDMSAKTDGGEVTVHYTDGTSEIIPLSNCEVGTVSLGKGGEKDVTVKYSDQHGNTAETTFKVLVKDVDKIEWVTEPGELTEVTDENGKTTTVRSAVEHKVGDTIVGDGTVRIRYNNGTSEVVGLDSAKLYVLVGGTRTTKLNEYGSKGITIRPASKLNSYDKNYNLTYSVNATYKESVELYTFPKRMYFTSETLSLDGAQLVVTARTGDKTYVNITEDMIVQGLDTSTTGMKTIIVKYTMDSEETETGKRTFQVNIKVNVVDREEMQTRQPDGLIVYAKQSHYYTDDVTVDSIPIRVMAVYDSCIEDFGFITVYNYGRTYNTNFGSIEFSGFDMEKINSIQTITVSLNGAEATTHIKLESGHDPKDKNYAYAGKYYSIGVENVNSVVQTTYEPGEKFYYDPAIRGANVYWGINKDTGKLEPDYDDANERLGPITITVYDDIPQIPTYQGFDFEVTISALGHFGHFSKGVHVNGMGSQSVEIEESAEVAEAAIEAAALNEEEPEETVTEVPVEENAVTENTSEETTVTEAPAEETPVTEAPAEETPVTEAPAEETTVTEVVTAEAEESPAMGESAADVRSSENGYYKASYSGLKTNTVYNYYVSDSSGNGLLNNLLYVGQGTSDSSGRLSFRYNTTTGSDGQYIIVKPMAYTDNSGSGGTDDTGSGSGTGGTGGSTVRPDASVFPANITTRTITVKVENKVTGEKDTADAKISGNSVSVTLGKDNNDYYANIFTTGGDYLTSALIENGKAEFNLPSSVEKFKVVIDTYSYGEDVSAGAGYHAVENPVSSQGYAVAVVLIAAFGIVFVNRKRSGKAGK